MMACNVARKTYSAEQLHRLRGSQSQPKLREAIEEHDSKDADIVKEHILRGSKSFAARSFRSRASANCNLRIPSDKSNDENTSSAPNTVRQPAGLHAHSAGQVLGEIQPNGQIVREGPYRFRPSPTPSMKKKKAEAIVKAHGSPTHVRVTAGGRIVPSEQSPLCHPRFGYSAIKTNGGLIKFAPNHRAGQPQWTQATENGFVAQDIHGNLCQIVNGTILPLNEVDGTLQLYVDAPNVSHNGFSLGPANQSFRPNGSQQLAPTSSHATPAASSEPPVAAQIMALEMEYSKFEQELKEVDKTEVIQGRTMGKMAKDNLISKRRELVTKMDRIRKAIKALKNQPPPNAPTSPRAMQNRQSMSPSRNRLPPFLHVQHAGNVPVLQPSHASGSLYRGANFGNQFGAQPVQAQNQTYSGQPWAMPPPGMFVPPPSFDGSMAAPLPAYQQPVLGSSMGDHHPSTLSTVEAGTAPGDGARLPIEQPCGSPSRSHAVSIKAPEPKQAVNLKSCLNPMSPVYKPATGVAASDTRGADATKHSKGGDATPHSTHRQAQPPLQPQKPSNATDNTISPAKDSAHLHSSSISSFATVDFFPRDTREYSTRQHAYSLVPDRSEDKENVSPDQAAPTQDKPPGTPAKHSSPTKDVHGFKGYSPQSGGLPVAPPGTPVQPMQDACSTAPPINIPNQRFDVPNRDAHNVSPKTKREWLFVQEHPGEPSAPNHYSAEKSHCRRDDIGDSSSPVHMMDFSQKPREWIEGFQAGLQRRPIESDRKGDYVDGYCSGLLKSKPSSIGQSSTAPSTGSPTKPISRRPSPALTLRTSGRLLPAEKTFAAPRPPFETAASSLDTLKQAVIAPQNEHAVLTPAIDGPHVIDTSFNLGAWAKSHPIQTDTLAGYHYPLRTSSVLHSHNAPSERHAKDFQQTMNLSEDARRNVQSTTAYLQPGGPAEVSGNFSPSPSTESIEAKHIASSNASKGGIRVSSITSVDSARYRHWPGSRIMTPTEWKSGSSIAHAAGLATGYFANAQFDGATQLQRTGPVVDNATQMPWQGRYREGSLDGLSNSPMSPPPPMSPTMSANGSPLRESGKKKELSSTKGPSPAKAKFEHIAGKVGIKVMTTNKTHDNAGDNAFEPGSPPDKRRWRDIWRKGGRDGTD